MNIFKNIIEKIYLSMDGNLVYFDELTHCYSRYYYDNVCKPKYLDKQINMIFCDINGLKEINDTQGHHIGTKLIKKVAADLLDLKYVNDVVRFGGDEFILFGDEGFDKTLLDSIENISYGIYKKEPGETLASACKKADASMYIMKGKAHLHRK